VVIVSLALVLIGSAQNKRGRMIKTTIDIFLEIIVKSSCVGYYISFFN
jgi:hypothetical protein